MSHVDDAAEVLAGYVPVDDNGAVPDHFKDFVAERVAARPSPAPLPAVDWGQRCSEQLDEILTILRGGTP